MLLSSAENQAGCTRRAIAQPSSTGGFMRAKLIVVVVAAVSANACSPGSEQTSDAAAPAGEWQTLFDGSSLAGWTQVGDANWQLMDGAVAAGGLDEVLDRPPSGLFDEQTARAANTTVRCASINSRSRW